MTQAREPVDLDQGSSRTVLMRTFLEQLAMEPAFSEDFQDLFDGALLVLAVQRAAACVDRSCGSGILPVASDGSLRC